MIVKNICTMKPAIWPTQPVCPPTPKDPKNGNPGIVPPWLSCPDVPRIMEQELASGA